MRALTNSERAVLEAFKDRDVFSDRDARDLGRKLGRRIGTALQPMWRRGLLHYLGLPYGPDGQRPTCWRNLWRVTAKGQRALQDGGAAGRLP